MDAATIRRCVAGALIFVAGCALVPQHSARLDEARIAYDAAARDPVVATLAPGELRRAAETLDRAVHSHDTLDDIAVVDHLAYVAKQQVAIACEVARQRGHE